MAGAGMSEEASLNGLSGFGVRRLSLLIALLVFLADQATKCIILYGFNLETSGAISVLPFLDFVLVWNRGISYGLFQQHEEIGRYGLILFSLIAIIGFLIWLRRIRQGLPALAIGLIVGGALGNAIDRLAYGAVIDFILLHWGEWRWYVFNIADAAIVIAVALLLADSWLGSPLRRSSQPAQERPS